MRKIIFLAFSLVGVVLACSPSKKNEDNHRGNDREQTTTHRFSDLNKLDTFKVQLIGKLSNDMQLVFTIKSHDGEEIYRHELKAKDVLKNYLATAEMKGEKEKVDFLEEELAFFFEERHFLEPAVTENEQPDKNVPDVSFYKELKNTGLNGFDYRLSKDNKIYIAWSRKEKRVKVYYQCC